MICDKDTNTLKHMGALALPVAKFLSAVSTHHCDPSDGLCLLVHCHCESAGHLFGARERNSLSFISVVRNLSISVNLCLDAEPSQ